MQIGICEWCAMAGGEELFRRLDRTGLSGVQVSYEPGFSEKMRQYAAWAKTYGVTLTSVGANVFCEKASFLPENAGFVRETVEDICKGAVLTEGRLFHAPSFGASEARTERELADTATALRLMCDTAAPYGVNVAMETPYSLEQNRALLSAVDRENFFLYFDTQNPETAAGHDATEQAAAFVGKIPEVHIKDCGADGRSVPLGQGRTRFRETLLTLSSGGYDGWLLLENAYDRAPDPEAAMRADADTAQRLWVCRS